MKATLFLLFFGMVFAKEIVELKVQYDPFQKAKKLIAKKENIKLKDDLALKSIKVKMKIKKRVKRRPPTITAIFNNKVFIDGKLFGVGQKVKGFKIAKVTKRGVWFKDYSGKRYFVGLIKYKKAYEKKEAK